MKDFYYRLIDKLFDEKVNNLICWVSITLIVCFGVFQALRHFFRIYLIA